MKWPRHSPGDASTDFLLGGGEMGERMRQRDWSYTPLGPAESWPLSLKTSISIMLASRFAMVVAWGPEFRFFYNDRYRPVLGSSKHPGALGTPSKEIFPEAWPFIGPLFESTRLGEAVALDDVLIPLDRNGYLENCYFTLSYSPIRDESGGVGGMLAVVAETTERLENERRLATLRELARHAGDVQTPQQAREKAMATLAANPIDIPFSLLYLVHDDGRRARLASSTGNTEESPAHPSVIDLTVRGALWPLAEAVENRQLLVLQDLQSRFGTLPGGPYPEPTHSAVIAPLLRPGQLKPDGILIFGVSPRRAFDDSYRGFFELAADHILTSIRNALAYQEERQRAQALAELDRAKTEFFSNVSHEFRTPLTLMLGPLEELLGQPAHSVSTDIREHVELAHRNSLRLLKLVNTLLDFSRIEAGRAEAVYEQVDLSPITAELASVFRSAMEKAGLQFLVNCPPIDQPVFVDREMWEKIVFNLLSNAFKFTFEGEVEVGLRPVSADRIELFVRDTGTGIPPEDLPHLFERFHRVRQARGRTHEGTGIGLALVQELVRLHGGTVGVESKPDEGSTFYVRLPHGSAHLPQDRIGASRTRVSTGLSGEVYIEEALRWLPADATRPSPSQPAPSSATDGEPAAARYRVILADDNADMRDYVARLLSERFRVESVADGLTALAAARRDKPDLILSDIMMTGLDGFGLLHAVRSDPELRTIPVILLSARAGEEARVEGIAAGADDYLVKPFSARELMARAETHLAMATMRRESEVTIRGLKEELHLQLDSARKARVAAETANRLKDEFLATVSHELRTPLNAILGWTRLLRGGKLDEDKKDQALEIVERNAVSQQQIIEDILDVSRIITGKLRMEVAPVELAAVIEAAIDSIEPSAEAKGVRLQPVISSGSNLVLGDANRLQQIVWNLLSNAVKFTPRGGRVQITLERVNSQAEITVSDTGQGISKDFLPYAFERFLQADSSSSRQYGGLGLGLAIVRHLTELNGGTVTASSPGENQGATFTVRLPLAIIHGKKSVWVQGERRVPEGGVGGIAVAYNLSLAGIRVLAVDDEADARDLLNAVLSQCNADVKVVATARDAILAIADWKPDVIISDIGMSEEDGYSLIRKIRALSPQNGGRIPAAALTAYARSEDRLKALSAGFQTHVTKPVDPSELVAVVASLAGRVGGLESDRNVR
jgi:signal transduction histidine kinase